WIGRRVLLSHTMLRCYLPRILWIAFPVLALFGSIAKGAESDIAQRIQRGESFLTNLFECPLRPLPEYKGSSTYWLFHDNYLAAHLLGRTRPDLAQRIGATLARFGVTNSGKIEIILGEAQRPLPFRTYVLTNVAIVEGKRIRTEL